MELEEIMRTAFAARQFTGEPVPDRVLYRILDNARFAPSGGNRQGWRVIIVRDPETRRALRELVVPTLRLYLAQMQAGENPFNTVVESSIDPTSISDLPVPDAMIDNVVEAPVLLVVCVDLSVVASFDSDLPKVGVISGASIYPFVWNILLAARNEGLGGALTTFVVGKEADAQDLLGLPTHLAVAAVLPIGRPVKQLTKLRRKRVEDFAMIDRWQGPTFGRGN
ncbi:MAG TPA: nitroreductase family protein [Dehalococcoidia bacterium]|nr:nitroreductase family protein [Dehalococcoidia bacterium]